MGDQTDDFNGEAGQDPAGDAVHVVDANNPQSLELLAHAYRDVYKQVIPEDQREPMEDWIDSLRGGNDVADMTVVLLGENLNAINPTLKGLSVGYRYRDVDAGLIAYSVMLPQFESPQLLQAMMDATQEGLQDLSRQKGGSLGPVFIETDDPAKLSGEERQDALDRVNMLQSIGGKLVNIVYVGPPVFDGGEKNENLRLMAYPGRAGVYPDKEGVKAVVTGIYNGLAEYSGMEPKDNPDYQASMLQANTANKLLADFTTTFAPAPRHTVLQFKL